MIPPTANNHHPPPTKMWTTTPAVDASSSAATATVATNTAPVKAADNAATNLQTGGNKATRVRSNRSRTTSGTAKIGSWQSNPSNATSGVVQVKRTRFENAAFSTQESSSKPSEVRGTPECAIQ